MKTHNGSKPKSEWKVPPGYKSAIGKARDKAKAELAKKGRVNAVTDNEDTASEGGESDSAKTCIKKL